MAYMGPQIQGDVLAAIFTKGIIQNDQDTIISHTYRVYHGDEKAQTSMLPSIKRPVAKYSRMTSPKHVVIR